MAVAQGIRGTKPTWVGGEGGSGNKKAVGAATALGLGVPQQNAMPSGMAGLGMAQHDPLDSPFGSIMINI